MRRFEKKSKTKPLGPLEQNLFIQALTLAMNFFASREDPILQHRFWTGLGFENAL